MVTQANKKVDTDKLNIHNLEVIRLDPLIYIMAYIMICVEYHQTDLQPDVFNSDEVTWFFSSPEPKAHR